MSWLRREQYVPDPTFLTYNPDTAREFPVYCLLSTLTTLCSKMFNVHAT